MEAGARDPSTAELRAAQPATPALQRTPLGRLCDGGLKVVSIVTGYTTVYYMNI
jgi:hypothetical protein